MGLVADLRILYHLVFASKAGATHRERLESFYKGQAGGYDEFRRRLLKGREMMYRSLAAKAEGGVWVDMGGGTGANIENLGSKTEKFAKLYVVDLSDSLLKVADERIRERRWDNVVTRHADVTTFVPDEGTADVVTFSYSLTMIPDWFAAMDQAARLLKPGGLIGVVDFYVPRKYPEEGLRRHGWWMRNFWPAWFASDNVFLSPDHLPYLCKNFTPISITERTGKVPYMLGLKVPYYRFIGRKT